MAKKPVQLFNKFTGGMNSQIVPGGLGPQKPGRSFERYRSKGGDMDKAAFKASGGAGAAAKRQGYGVPASRPKMAPLPNRTQPKLKQHDPGFTPPFMQGTGGVSAGKRPGAPMPPVGRPMQRTIAGGKRMPQPMEMQPRRGSTRRG